MFDTPEKPEQLKNGDEQDEQMDGEQDEGGSPDIPKCPNPPVKKAKEQADKKQEDDSDEDPEPFDSSENVFWAKGTSRFVAKHNGVVKRFGVSKRLWGEERAEMKNV